MGGLRGHPAEFGFVTKFDGSPWRVLNGKMTQVNLCFQKIALAAVHSVCTALVQ